MAGIILQAAKRDAKRFVKAGGFEVDIHIKTPDNQLWADIKGLATKHHINFDTDGQPVNSKNVHICIDESDLESETMPIRDSDGEVNLLNYRVRFADSSGVDRDYVVLQNYPDEVLGLIVCILGDFKPS